MKPETQRQKEVLDAICAICADTGRAATLNEVAARVGKGVSTIHKHVQHLIETGLVRNGRGLQPMDARFEAGWIEGVTYLGREVGRILVENHAGEAVIKAVALTVEGAKAITGEGE